MKKVEFIFDESQVGFGAELHDITDTISITLTEFQENNEKSTDGHKYIEPRHTTEVFISVDEAKAITRALQFLIKEDNPS